MIRTPRKIQLEEKERAVKQRREAEWSLMQHLNRYGVTLVPNLLFDAYHELGLDESELTAVMHLLRCRLSVEGSQLPLSDYLMEKMRRSRSEINFLLKSLQRLGVLDSLQDPGIVKPQDASLQGLYGRLLAWNQLPEEQKSSRRNLEDAELYRLFESSFQHLNEFEYEQIRSWLEEDQWPPEVIREALKTAALARTLNFRYIARTLDNWKRKGCLTLEQVQAENAAFERRKLLLAEARETESAQTGKPSFRSASSSRRRRKEPFRIGSLSQNDETEEERKKRFDKIIE